MKIMILILSAILFIGCATTQVEQPIEIHPEVSDYKYKAAWDSKPEGAQWTEFTLEAIEKYGQGLMKVSSLSDAKEYCPKFDSLNIDQKKQVWIMLISAMAKRESNFNPKTNYTEDFNDSSGNAVISRGLLQISKESANQSAYGCKINNASELNHPKINLTCGVKILNKWIPQDKAIGIKKLGGARYWSVLRDTSSSQSYIREQVKSLDFCK